MVEHEPRDLRRERRDRMGHQVGHAVVVLGRQTDPELHTERARDVALHELPDRHAADPAHQLAREPSVGQRVVAVGAARREVRRGRGQPRRDRVPVESLLEGHRPVHGVQTGTVPEQLGHGDRVLAVRGELGPVRGDPLAVVQQAALHAHRHGERGHALRGAEDDLERIGSVGHLAVPVTVAAHEVDHQLPAVHHRDTGAAVLPRLEVGHECVAHRLPAGCDEVDCQHGGIRRR